MSEKTHSLHIIFHQTLTEHLRLAFYSQDDPQQGDRRGRGGIQHFQHLATAASLTDDQGLNSTHFFT